MTDADLERLLVLDNGAGPALALDRAHADAIIDAALDGAGFGPGPSGGGSTGSAGSGGMAAGTKLAILGGAALVVVAIVLYAGRGRHRTPEVAVAPVADAAVIDDRGGGSAPIEKPAAAASADAGEVVEDDITIEPPATEPPAAGLPASRPPGKHATPSPRTSPADLLGEANAKRAAKEWRESDRLYARVVERAPKSLAAQTALIASASLHLEHLGDPKGALRRLRRALAIAPSGPLAEEARWGIAEAARATHDRAAEAAALDDFLAHHTSSPLAPRAKTRRAELP